MIKNNAYLSHTRLYRVWYDVVYRCTSEKSSQYKYYGAKGITVYEKWVGKNGFANFRKWALENGYKEEILPSGRNKYTIDRIDTTKGYFPENCRWVGYDIQNCNHILLSTNTSGYRGVSWSKKEKKWICVISINHKSKRIGGYYTQKDAVEARNKFIDENNLPHQKNVYIGELK
ncbi:MAG: hypothetical protein J6S85_21595 [Methanobrevibacter sp.]|nr:hypothetical protein [Methanobrevibacter sp.]